MTDYKQICRNLIAAIDAEAREHTLGFELLKAYAEAEELLLLCGHAPGPELQPAGPTDDDLDLLVIAIQALHDPSVEGHNLDAVDRGRELLRAALTRWGNNNTSRSI